MVNYPIHIGETALPQLAHHLQVSSYSRIIVLVDEQTLAHCYPLLQPHLPEHTLIQITSGEAYKNLETCSYIWQEMTTLALDRKAVMLNLGGGVIGDMGGFVAATYKRGISFIQIPTTLLSQVDASVGGKLGIDFQGLKNHIGMYKEPEGVFIVPEFLKSLPYEELRSGFAEVIKHHLIADRTNWQALKELTVLAPAHMQALIQHSVAVKSKIVESDPQEQGLRKALNYGHTIGHAVETHFLNAGHPILHGEAVALGMIAESYLSYERGFLSKTELEEIESYLRKMYPHVNVASSSYEAICALALQDKKNLDGRIMCTLLEGIGRVKVNQEIKGEDIISALTYYGRTVLSS